jgi:hypothetical protein
MNTQNILGFYGYKLDLQLDSSEFYDFELSKDDYIDGSLTNILSYDPVLSSDFTNNIDVPYQVGIDQNSDIKRRNELGWTANFVFNRNNLPWSSGSVFYYWGITNETTASNYLDNNLSFQFTDEGEVSWYSYHYSGLCDSTSGYTTTSYVASGKTDTLCSNGTNDDFTITVTFERNYTLTECSLDNDGGWNDMIPGPHAVPYSDSVWDGPTANTGSFIGHADQIVTGYTMTTGSLDWLTGATQYTYVEVLNKKWWNSRNMRLGTLKIYLNGVRIYKLLDWEEIIPSQRSSINPMIQSWGGGTSGSLNLHVGDTQFLLKNIKYYDVPLDFVQVKTLYNQIKPSFSISECNEPCVDNVSAFSVVGLLTEINEYIYTEDGNLIIY